MKKPIATAKMIEIQLLKADEAATLTYTDTIDQALQIAKISMEYNVKEDDAQKVQEALDTTGALLMAPTGRVRMRYLSEEEVLGLAQRTVLDGTELRITQRLATRSFYKGYKDTKVFGVGATGFNYNTAYSQEQGDYMVYILELGFFLATAMTEAEREAVREQLATPAPVADLFATMCEQVQTECFNQGWIAVRDVRYLNNDVATFSTFHLQNGSAPYVRPENHLAARYSENNGRRQYYLKFRGQVFTCELVLQGPTDMQHVRHVQAIFDDERLALVVIEKYYGKQEPVEAQVLVARAVGTGNGPALRVFKATDGRTYATVHGRTYWVHRVAPERPLALPGAE